MEILQVPIDQTALSVRARHALQRHGIQTVGAMMGCSQEELRAMRNLGEKTVREILDMASKYQSYLETGSLPAPAVPAASVNTEALFSTPAGRDQVIAELERRGIGIDVLEQLPARIYNVLMIRGWDQLFRLAFRTETELMQIPGIGGAEAACICRLCSEYLQAHAAEYCQSSGTEPVIVLPEDLSSEPACDDRMRRYLQENDKPLEWFGLTPNAAEKLRKGGLNKLSDCILQGQTKLEMVTTPKGLSVIRAKIQAYMDEHGQRLEAYRQGDDSALLQDENIRDRILSLYHGHEFSGFSLSEMLEALQLPEGVETDRVKRIIGGLLADKQLEYVDFRCYRVYPRFVDALQADQLLDPRNKRILTRRLQGDTLDAIGQDENLTRERVRQIVEKAVKAVARNAAATGLGTCFDEDYYRYFYEHYQIDRADAAQWLGISPETYMYLELSGTKKGGNAIGDAIEDTEGLEAGLRLKVRNYINRNRILLDGMWVGKTRGELQKAVVRTLCREKTSYQDFVDIYNDFLRQQEIPFDEKLYLVEDVVRTRENRLTDARFLLWTQNKNLRYYDIDGRDYTELLDELNLDAYENTEISTRKLTNDHPEIMEKYDIRDHYELHNLLRKIVPEGSYHDFRCVRMPNIAFGTFDREAALLELITENAPISMEDLTEIIQQEYGYETGVIQGTYLQPLKQYYHQGMYTVEQKVMSEENRAALLAALQGDFFYIGQLRSAYQQAVPDADPDEINPFNLKGMGFQVLSQYALRNYPTMDAYIRQILTNRDVVDLLPIRARHARTRTFSNTLSDMRRDYQIIEFEPNKLISIRKLQQSGVGVEQLKAYCDAVYRFAPDGGYFSISSLRQDGFHSELEDLGFSDWFYGSLLAADSRFSLSMVFGAHIFFKGQEEVTIRSFESALICQNGSIDLYDLMSLMTDRYGCCIEEKSDLVSKVGNTRIYYDRILDRLYESEDRFYRELDGKEA